MATKTADVPKSRPRSHKPPARTAPDASAFFDALMNNLHYRQAKLPQHATPNDWYMALACTVRDRMLERYIKTVETIAAPHTSIKTVAYLSAEFLTGPHLGNGLLCLGLWDAAEEAVSRAGQRIDDLLEQEEE